MERLIRRLYHHQLISHFFHTLLDSIQRELDECDSVLDLGCGPDSPIRYCDVEYSLGVDAFKPYIRESKKKKTHNDYLLADITKAKFKPRSFDAVLLIDVLEHLEKEQGKKLLQKAEKWAKKKLVISAPNDFLPQASIDDNPFQAHRSGWAVEEMEKLGYKAHGMAGWKVLRGGSTLKEGYQEGDIFATIRFRPKIFWLVISTLTQAVTYYFPKLAFSVFYVKNL